MAELKISVFTTCYNQENFIAEAIESVVNQSVHPFEFIICDDCSQDGTWEIVQKYQLIYPQIIKSYRNEINLGLYPNFNFAQSLVTGNLITCVSGDDFILPNYFKDIFSFVEDNKLDPENDSFLIISNTVNLFPSGLKTYYSNQPFKDKSLFSCRLRYVLDERFGFVSKKSFEKTGGFKTNIGLHADYLWGFDRIVNTENIYFIDKYHSVYRVGVGVASKTKVVESNKSFLEILEIVKTKYSTFLNPKDELFYKFITAKCKYIINSSIKNYFILLNYTFRNLGNFGSSKKQFKAFSFILIPNFLKKIVLKINFIKFLSK